MRQVQFPDNLTHSKRGSPISLKPFKLSLAAGYTRLQKASCWHKMAWLEEFHSPCFVSMPDFAVEAFIAHLNSQQWVHCSPKFCPPPPIFNFQITLSCPSTAPHDRPRPSLCPVEALTSPDNGCVVAHLSPGPYPPPIANHQGLGSHYTQFCPCYIHSHPAPSPIPIGFSVPAT